MDQPYIMSSPCFETREGIAAKQKHNVQVSVSQHRQHATWTPKQCIRRHTSLLQIITFQWTYCISKLQVKNVVVHSM